MTTLLIATRNVHKAGEIRAVLSGQFKYLTLKDFPGAPNVVENAATFEGNAVKKSVELVEWLIGNQSYPPKGNDSLFVLADDSGLEVDALNGAPGVHSARFAALDPRASGNTSDAENNAKLLDLLRDVPLDRRGARFRCVLALTELGEPVSKSNSPVCALNEPEFQTMVFNGICEGQIGLALSGEGGFGYDPLFIPEGRGLTFAELGETVKNQLSHRAKALSKLRAHFALRE